MANLDVYICSFRTAELGDKKLSVPNCFAYWINIYLVQ